MNPHSNETLNLLMKHRSIRKFTGQPVSDELRDTIIMAAQMASTSSNVQAYSVIHVSDPTLKNRLAELAGNQAYVAECPLLLVWCADLFRLREAFGLHGDPETSYLELTENFIVSTVDTALAAQNAAVAAESLGLGVVYIGGIRNNIQTVSEVLKLPKCVYPVFGMCIGYPNQDPLLRPRLPLRTILHENSYNSEHYIEGINEYDQMVREYMRKRSNGKSMISWSEQMYARLSKPVRAHMKSFLQEQGFRMD